MDREPKTAYEFANRLAAQQLKPLRDFVERTSRQQREAKSGQASSRRYTNIATLDRELSGLTYTSFTACMRTALEPN